MAEKLLTPNAVANMAPRVLNDSFQFGSDPQQWEEDGVWHATRYGRLFPWFGAVGKGTTREEAMEDLERVYPIKVREHRLNSLRDTVAELEYEIAGYDAPARLEEAKRRLAEMEREDV